MKSEHKWSQVYNEETRVFMQPATKDSGEFALNH